MALVGFPLLMTARTQHCETLNPISHLLSLLLRLSGSYCSLVASAVLRNAILKNCVIRKSDPSLDVITEIVDVDEEQ